MNTLEQFKEYLGFQLTFNNHNDAQAFAGPRIKIDNSDMIDEWVIVVSDRCQDNYDSDMCDFGITYLTANNELYSVVTGRCPTQYIMDAIKAQAIRDMMARES